MKFTIGVSKAEMQELQVDEAGLVNAVSEHLRQSISVDDGASQIYLGSYSVDVVVV